MDNSLPRSHVEEKPGMAWDAVPAVDDCVGAPSKNGDDGHDGCYESWHG